MPDIQKVFKEIMKFCSERLSKEDMSDLEDMIRGPGDGFYEKPDADNYAMDSARGGNYAVREMQALRLAEDECRPVLGEGARGFDSAASLYGAALLQMGMDRRTVRQTPGANLRGIFNTMRNLQGRASSNGAALAMDARTRSAAAEKFLEDFPGAVLPRLA